MSPFRLQFFHLFFALMSILLLVFALLFLCWRVSILIGADLLRHGGRRAQTFYGYGVRGGLLF